jgi:hypothetical protein
MLQIFILFKNAIMDLWKRDFCHIYRTIEVRLEASETAVVILNTQATGHFHNIHRVFYITYINIFLQVNRHFFTLLQATIESIMMMIRGRPLETT